MKKEPKNKPAESVDDYLAVLSPEVQDTLGKIRKAIRAAAPKAEEVISYQIPTYKQDGPVACFAAFPNHCSFYTTSHAVIAAFKKELEPYDVSGVTIRFPVGKPLPATLIKKLVGAKLMENEERMKKKKPAAKKKGVKKAAPKKTISKKK